MPVPTIMEVRPPTVCACRRTSLTTSLGRGSDIVVGIRISQGKFSDNHHQWASAERDAATIFRTLADPGIDYIHTTEYRALAPAFAAS